MPSYQDLEDALDALETYVSAQIPIITRSLQRLTDDLKRFGPPELPPMPEIPSFPIFASVPPPPPPPPPPTLIPLTYTERLAEWTGKHKYALIGVGAVGLGLAAGGYGYLRRNRMTIGVAHAHTRKPEGKEVVVVLGADSPLGPLVVSDLRAKGYVVIASVSSAETIPDIEKIDRGYVRALVLDPYDPASTTPFMRSLQTTLSLKFPLAPGDPYRTPSPSELPILVSLISLLSLVTPPSATPGNSMSISSPPHALSTLSISKDYLPHLVATHLTPLTIIQSILPLLRATGRKGTSRTSIVIALPGGPTAAGLVGQDASPALSSAAMSKSTEILRRELAMTPDLHNTRVVVIDVGELSLSPVPQRRRRGACARRPVDARQFSEAVTRIVTGPQSTMQCLGGRSFVTTLRIVRLSLRDWWRGDRFSIGSGAAIYSFASFLPARVLDTLLLLPERLVSYHENIRRKARAMKREGRRQQKDREHEPHDSDSSKGKQVMVVPKLTSSPPSTLSSISDGRASAVVSSVPSPLSSPALSQHNLESGAVSSVASSEDGSAHQERIAESWVMDVEAGAEDVKDS